MPHQLAAVVEIVLQEQLDRVGREVPYWRAVAARIFADEALDRLTPANQFSLFLCVPVNSSERRHDGGRQGQAMTRSARSSELGDESDNLCPRIDVFSPDCNSLCIPNIHVCTENYVRE
jgi:hypothetical protein